MSVSVEVPPLGDSVTEAIIAEWNKSVGDYVNEDDILVELETDKVAVEVPAPVSGVIKEIKFDPDDTVNVGDVIAVIEPGEGAKASAPAADAAPARAEAPPAAQATTPAPAASGGSDQFGPAVQRMLDEHGLDPSKIPGSGPNGRLLKEDVQAFVDRQSKPAAATPSVSVRSTPSVDPASLEERVKMTPLRKTIARRLVEAQQTTAMLTTFNEADMTGIMQLRKRYQDRFVKRYDTKVGFMSFFVKAAVEALKEFPAINAEIDGDHIIYKHYYHVGIAVGGGKGLVVPVIRDADQMSFAEIELEIKRLAGLAQTNKLKLENLQGGTFTISNGGVYGSMMSTPILNSPQSGILGMHNIVQRPVVVDGEIVIRPMMYLALSYDHRIVDGKGAVSFLVRLKELVENPERILLEV